MKIKKITAKNFWSYQTLDFSFEKGLCLVDGLNHDEGGSNGSGKSTLPNCLCFAIFGDMPKKLKIDSVINRHSDGECLIEVDFEDNNTEYKIIRGRSPNILKFFINGEQKSDVDSKQTQNLIEKTIGITYDIFLASTYFSQNSPNFLHSNDESKKSIMTEISDLKIFDKAELKIKESLKKEEGGHYELKYKIESLKTSIKILEDQKPELMTNSKFFDEDQKNKLKTLSDEILKIQEEIKTLNAKKTHYESELRVNEESYNRFIQIEKPQVNNSLVEAETAYNESLKLKYQLEANVASISKELTGASDEAISQDFTKFTTTKAKCLEIQKELTTSLEKINETITNYQSELQFDEELKSVEIELMRIHNKIEENKTRKITLEAELEQKKKEYQRYNLEADNCPTCQQKVDHVLLGSHKDTVGAEILNLSMAINLINSVLADLDVSFNVADTRSLIALNKERINKDLADELKKQNEVTINLNNIQNSIDSVENGLKSLEDRVAKNTRLRHELELDLAKIKEIEGVINKISIHTIKSRISELLAKEQLLLACSTKSKGDLQLLELTLNNYISKEKEYIATKSKLMLEKNPYQKMIAENDSKISGLKDALEFDLAEFNIISKNIEDLIYLREVFSNKGMKSYVFDSIINELNLRVSGYLKDLFSDDVRVVFLSESETSKGEVRQKFSTKYYVNNIEVEHGSFSGGEDRRLQFAVNLSLADICANRSAKNFNVLFFDESFDGLDFEGKEKCMGLLQKISENRDCILVIDHASEFQSAFENVIRAEKKNGISTLVYQ